MRLVSILLSLALSAAPALAQNNRIPITDLPTASTPLNGSEVVPIVQSGVTKKISPLNFGFLTITGTVSPYSFGGSIGGVFSALGSVTTAGVWTITPSAINNSQAGPAWGSYTTQYFPAISNIGNLPLTSMVGGYSPGGYVSGGMTAALVGALDTPSTDTALLQPGNVPGNINIGTVGNCRTASTIKGCVGVFGGGMANADTTQVFGANFVASNNGYLSGTNAGFKFASLAGLEVDMPVIAPSSGTLPGVMYGIILHGEVNGSSAKPTGGTYGLTIFPASLDGSVGWDCAICLVGGSNTEGLRLGPQGTSNNNVKSQPINFQGYASTSLYQNLVYGDIFGNLSMDVANGIVVNYSGSAVFQTTTTSVNLNKQAIFAQGFKLANLAASNTAPTIGSGFGTSPSIVASNGTVAFQINVGTGGTASSGVITMPTATNGWSCSANDVTTQSTSVFLTKQIASTTSSVTITNYNISGVATAWVASDKINLMCMAF